jgi:hypothetical protein
MADLSEQQAQDQRQRYIEAWNKTMVEIWKDNILKLDVFDTGALYNSTIEMPIQADGRFFQISLSHEFLEYGLWQDYGTGREVARGNSGDIGRDKVRERRRWFSVKYYSSCLNLRDFMADNVGQEFCGIFTELLSDKLMKQSTQFYKNN